MKKWQKFVLLVMSFNILFFAVDAKKREAEAFAVSTAAMVLGGLAILGVGATLLSRQNADKLGSSIISNLGDSYADAVNFNSVTETGRIVMSPAMRIAMNKAIGDRKSSVAGHKAVGEVPYFDIGSGSNNVGIRVNSGDMVRISFSYQGLDNFDGATSVYLEDIRGKDLVSGMRIYGVSGVFNEVLEVSSIANDSLGYIRILKNNHGNHHAISNLKITNLSTVNTPEAIEYRQYENIPSDSTERLNLINNTVTQNEYVIDGSNIKEGVSSISQLEQKIDEIGDTQQETNITIGKIFGALGNMPAAIATGIGNAFGWLQGLLTNIWNAILGIPAAVAGAMSGLWVDAGLVWSGIKDSVNATNNWLNNVLTGALDGLSNGIDNLARVFQDTWAGIESGLAAIGQNVLALPQTLLDDLTEIKTVVTALAIPTALDMSTYTNKMDELRQNMTSKFEFITLPVQQIKSVFASPKSLYDVKFTVLKQDVYVLPRMFEPVVNITKNVLTGSAVISTFISIYRRFTPEEVIA